MLRCIIVDDEYLALDLLQEFISRLPELELVGRAKNPIEARAILEKETVDLMFLDIQMPVLSGINFLKSLRQQPIVIFTTAYSDHAVEAFNLDAIDYLLKPFTFERFIQAVDKAKAHYQMQNNESSTSSDKNPFISMKSDGKLVKIFIHEISYIESLKEYVIIHGSFGRHIVYERLKNMEGLLPKQTFLRVHKSFLVNKSEVDAQEGNMLLIGDIKVPISRDKKKEIGERIFGV